MVAFSFTIVLLVLLALGVPVGFTLLITGVAGLFYIGGEGLVAGVLRTAPLSSVSTYELITVPMFILMAEFVILSGVADSLFKAAATWIGRVRGGLAIATAVAGAGFGAISGSSTASAATLAATSIPAMLREKYEPRLACGVVAISGTLAMLIPPSIALVIYGIIADVSIGQLLVAGIVPGILVLFTIAATVVVLVKLKPEHAPLGRRYTWREKLASLRVAGPLLFLFLAVTGIIYLGVATPTEAAGIGAFGAMLLTLLAGKLSWRTALEALGKAMGTTCMIMMIIMGAKVFTYFFTLTQATQQLVGFVGAMDVHPWVIMAVILLGYLILGFFMDQIAILILTVPVVLPVIMALGFDPVWFGVIVIVIAEIGLVTPPLGLNVFVVSKYTGRPLGEVFWGVAPHVYAHLLLVVVMCLFPALVLWLPSTMR